VEADIERCVPLGRLAAPQRSAGDWRASLLRDVESLDEIVGYGRARSFEPASDAPVDTVPPGYYLTGLFVLPRRRGLGIGAALTQARLDWIADRAGEVWFFANARNTASIELHRRFGFEEAGRRFSFPGLTFEGGEGILFRLRLDAPHRPGV
jgi:ribosomal protein S18 acetylase RimI-like enzyme